MLNDGFQTQVNVHIFNENQKINKTLPLNNYCLAILVTGRGGRVV